MEDELYSKNIFLPIKKIIIIGLVLSSDGMIYSQAFNLTPPKEVEYKKQENDGKGIAQIQEELAEEERTNKKDYYKNPRSYGTNRILSPPAYAKTLSETGYSSFKDLKWIESGMDYRTRNEYRENDLRRADSGIDRPLLLRSRAYFAVKEKLDPFRFAFEVEDAQRKFSKYEIDDRDYNRAEPINAYGEFHLKNGLGNNRPFSVKYGIQSFEFLDRRLIASNEWRNTTNTFQGFRVTLGKDQNNWSVDILGLQPLERLEYDVDKRIRNQFFGGVIGHIRQWSNLITIEPFYLGLNQSPLNQVKYNPTTFSFADNSRVGREIHTTGVRLYNIYFSGFDYDISAIYQFGVNDLQKQQRHEAYSFLFDAGYTYNSKWKPRTGFFYGYVSGDRNPNDNTNQRFERLYGFARPWSSNDYVQMENVQTPKFVFEFEPITGVKIDTACVWFYLASATDRWNAANRIQDKTGKSGNYMGFEYNFRIRFDVMYGVKANIGYAYFKPGEFTVNTTGRDQNSNFVYLEMTYSLFN